MLIGQMDKQENVQKVVNGNDQLSIDNNYGIYIKVHNY